MNAFAGRRATVLVVVADHAPRDAIVGGLVQAEVDVVQARDGRRALAAIDRHRADAVILDVDLPDVDGWTVLQHVHLARFVPPTIVVSAGDSTGSARARALGAVAYFERPVPLADLLERTHLLLTSTPVVDSDVRQLRSLYRPRRRHHIPLRT